MLDFRVILKGGAVLIEQILSLNIILSLNLLLLKQCHIIKTHCVCGHGGPIFCAHLGPCSLLPVLASVN